MLLTIIFITVALAMGFWVGFLVGRNRGDIIAQEFRTSDQISTVKNEAHVVEEARLNARVEDLQIVRSTMPTPLPETETAAE